MVKEGQFCSCGEQSPEACLIDGVIMNIHVLGIRISGKCLQALTLLNRAMIHVSRFGVCSYHWLCVLCWQVFEELLLDADWSVNAGMWMWLSCSSFFQQFFHCYCPVGFGKRADPTGDFIRYLISYLWSLQIRYLFYLSLLHDLQVNNKTILHNTILKLQFKKKKNSGFSVRRFGIIMLVMNLGSEYFNFKSVWF